MARQLRISGTERPSIKEIDEAAEELRSVREEAAAVKEREKHRTDLLIAAMKKHGVTEYRDDDAVPPLLITLTTGADKVKVTEVRPIEEDGDGETRVRKGRSAASAASDPLEAEADRILENAGSGKLNDPKLKGEPARHKKAKSRSAKEVGTTT